MRRRLFDSEDLFLKDPSSVRAAVAILQSPEPKEVNHALEFLEKAEYPELDGHLAALVAHPSTRGAFERPVQRRAAEGGAGAALRVVVGPARDGARDQGGGDSRTLRAEGRGRRRVLPYLDGSEPEIRTAALVGLFRHGGISGVLTAAERFRAMAGSPDIADKVSLARVLGEVGDRTFYQPLLPLLDHESIDVRKEALIRGRAGRQPAALAGGDRAACGTPGCVRRRCPPCARPATTSCPSWSLPWPHRRRRDTRTTLGLIRVCVSADGGKVVDLLVAVLDHPDREIQYEVLQGAANSAATRPGATARRSSGCSIGLVRVSATILVAMRDLGDEPDVALLMTALQGELAAVRSKIFLLLSFLYDARAVLGAERKLQDSRPSQRGLALELLDVMFSKELKRSVFALIDDNVPLDRRVRDLEEQFALEGRAGSTG